MPRVHHVKAAKDYPQYGIKKGDMHYTWSMLFGPRSSKTFRQLAAPKRSQLTTSEFLSTIYDIEDSLSALTDLDDIEGIVQELRDCAENEQGKYDNMPEGLQQGSTGQMLESRAEGCNNAADELEGIDTEFEGDDGERDGWLEERLMEVQGVSISYD